MTNFHITLDRSSPSPLQNQLIAALKKAISQVQPHDDLRLPSSRALAHELGVSRIVTLTAYEQLCAEDYLITLPGSGTFINKTVLQTSKATAHNRVKYHGPAWFHSPAEKNKEQVNNIDFSLGRPSTSFFDTAAWKRSWRYALSLPFVNDAPPAAGQRELREAIAHMVARNREIRCTAEDIIITSGTVDSLTLLARVTAPFKPISYIENPGFPIAAQIFHRYGHETQPLAIDEQGLILPELPQSKDRAKIIFCTPSHQFPLGIRLSLSRRLTLLQWARRQDAIILEDDYDSEFRYDVAPLPSLKAQDESGHVIYISSLSKSLSPAIRLGYMIAPENIRSALTQEISANHMQPPWLLQRAMAHFIQKGELDKHIRRMRRHYETLHKAMRLGLKNLPPDVKLLGIEAGLHCFLEIADEQRRQRLHQSLMNSHITVRDFDRHNFAPSRWKGIALGYGHLTTEEIRTGLSVITDCLNSP